MRNDIKNHFSKAAYSFNNRSWVKSPDVINAICSLFQLKEEGSTKLLDLGAGTGSVSQYIEQLFPNIHIYALDICKEMLQQIHSEQIEKIWSDVSNIPMLDECFDIIVSRQCLHYVDDLPTTISESFRVLKKNGVFILAQIIPCDNNSKEYWAKIAHKRQPLRHNFFSLADWQTIFTNNGFKILKTLTLNHKAKLSDWVKASGSEETIAALYDMVVNAPQEYKASVGLTRVDDDYSMDIHWLIMSMQKQ